MRRLLIVGDHPSLHRGFATVARHVARGLHATGRWHVQVIGRHPPAAGSPPEPYDVFAADTPEDGDGEGDARLRHLLQSALGEAVHPSARVTLVSIGTAFDQQILIDALDDRALRRRVSFVAYLPVNYAPLPPWAGRLFARFDHVVPFTAFAARAAAAVCVPTGPPAVSAPIPHGVDTTTFRRPDPEARRRTRLRAFDADDGAFVVGFFGRNSAHKRPDVALRIFATFALGAWSTCEACGGVSAWDLDPLDGARTAPTSCVRCGSAGLTRGRPQPEARLYLHTDLLTPLQRAWAGGWDLARLVSGSGVADRVVLAASRRVGEGIGAEDLAARMGACDVHLLPSEGGGWELTVLETGACGVPNVITDAGGPPEYAAPFSLLVPPAARVFGRTGLAAHIDEGAAVQALTRLAADRRLGGTLGEAGVAVAAAHDWDTVTRAWDRLLGSLPPG
ncbi:MAG: glycosyltransferase [Vicinamibacterales bacterium]